MKKTLKIMLAAVLSIAMLMTFAAATTESDTIDTHHDEHALDIFADAPAADSWKYQGLNCAVNNGTMTGHNNKIRPDDSLTRAEMVTMMVRVLGAHATKAQIEHYVDVVAGQWYYEALQSGVAVKIINGSGDKMMPNDPITREQTFTILARTFLFSADTDAVADFVDNSKVSSWAKNATNALIDADVVRGDNTKTLRPQDNVTRAEFAAMLDRVACLFANTGASYSGKTVSGSVILNDATADLSGATIEGDLIITDAVGAQNIDLSNVTVTGRIVIRGGDVNLNQGTIAAQVVVGNPTGASKVTAAAGVEVPKVVVAENANDVEIDVPAKEVVIDSSKNEVVINKDAEEVTVNGSDNTVKVTEGTKVDSVKTEGNNTNVAVDKGAKVENVTVNGESSKVTGSGSVGNATVNGYDSKVETPNTNVTDNSPATKPGSDDTTKPSTGDDKTDSGKDDGKDNGKNESQGPNSDASSSGNSASLPSGSGNTTVSTPVELVEGGTYITRVGGDNFVADIKTESGIQVVEFDFTGEDAAQVYEKMFVKTKAGKSVDCVQTLVSFKSDVEVALANIIAGILDTEANTNDDALVPIEGEALTHESLIANMETAVDLYNNGFEDTFKSFGIVCAEDAGKITATFTGKIDGKTFKLRLIVTANN